MFTRLYYFWNERGWEICILLSIFFLLSVAIYNWIQKLKKKKSKSPYKKKENTSYFAPDPSDKFCSKLELRTKFVLEKIFKKRFDKIRPEWLTNNITKKPLEIDLYNDELKLGVECQGKQHYVFTPFFQKTKQAFREQQYRDEIKRMLCERRGITLIEVPYNINENSIESFILSQLVIKKLVKKLV